MTSPKDLSKEDLLILLKHLKNFERCVGNPTSHNDEAWQAKILEYKSALPERLQEQWMPVIAAYALHSFSTSYTQARYPNDNYN